MIDCGEADVTKLRRLVLLVAVSLALFNCVGVMNITVPTDKEITLNDITEIKAGMSEAAVIERLGRPLSFGVDRDGLEFLHYESANLSGTGAVIPTPLIGGESTSFEVKGWAANIFIEQGIVRKSGYTIYQDNRPDR